MSDEEEKIARYLEDNRTTIVPNIPAKFSVKNIEVLSFFQYGTDQELGDIIIKEGKVLAESAESVRKQLQLPGFGKNVVRPLRRLLRKYNCDFYAHNFDPVHEAINRVEDKYNHEPPIWRDVPRVHIINRLRASDKYPL